MGYTVGGAFLSIAILVGIFVWVALAVVAEWVKRSIRQPASSASSPPESPEDMAPKYHAHGPDDSIIGTFDTILDAEICGLTAAGVKAVDLPWVLHERRRLGTYGSFREPEQHVVANEPNRQEEQARRVGRTVGDKEKEHSTPSVTWGDRIREAPDLRQAYPVKRLSDCRGPISNPPAREHRR
jgi:hypothetical protein